MVVMKMVFFVVQLRKDLIIVKRGLASGSFIKSLDERLGESCDDEATIHALMIMVDQFI